MNYRRLLKAYMAHIICCEGTAFVPDQYDEDFGCLGSKSFFSWTKRQQKALVKLANEVDAEMKMEANHV